MASARKSRLVAIRAENGVEIERVEAPRDCHDAKRKAFGISLPTGEDVSPQGLGHDLGGPRLPKAA